MVRRDDDDTSADVGAMKVEDSAGGQVEESSDEHPGRAYHSCKPLMPWAGPQAAPADNGSRLLFGNENMYIFFRLFR